MTRSSVDRTNFKVGLFVVCTCVLLAGSAIFLVIQKRTFASVQIFQLSSESAAGLTVGMPLLYSGFEVGEVAAVTLTREGTVAIEVEVPTQHRFRINGSSVFYLDQPLIGMARLNVRTTVMDEAAPEPSHIYPVIKEDEMDAVLQNLPSLIRKVDGIASNLDSLTAPGSDLDQSLKNLNAISHAIAQKQGAEVLLGDGGAAELRRGIASLHTALSDASKLLSTSNDVLNSANTKLLGKDGTVSKLNDIGDDLRSKLKTLDGLVVNLVRLGERIDSSTEDLPVLRQEIDLTVDSANQLMKDVRSLLPVEQKKDIPLP